MDVILKKTKVTSSIMKQVLQRTITSIGFKKPLGMVIHDKKSWYLFYDELKNELLKIPSVVKLNFEEEWVQVDNIGNRELEFYIFVEFLTYHSRTSLGKNKNEALTTFNHIKSQIDKIKEIGQIYI